ncbi:MAG: GNAT family N-acetyltransferase [Chloroflexota bacterium]
MGTVRFWEEVTANMAPAVDQLLYEGWLLRLTQGFSRNNNSVWPLYTDGRGLSKQSLVERLAFCEAQYAAYGLTCAFRLTDIPEHRDIDAFLAERGYGRSNPNFVMVKENVAGPEVDIVNGDIANGDIVELTLDDYLDTIYRLRPGDPAIKAWERQIYQRLALPSAYVVVEREGKVCGYGRSVQQANILRVKNLWVSPDYRGQGVATQLMHGLFQLGRKDGATKVIVAVNEDNHVARRLYERLGFVNRYLYWYRVPVEEAD